MTRRSAVEAMLKRYGSPAVLNGVPTAAAIRPLQIQDGADNALTGGDSGLYYRYTGPAGSPLSEGDTVEAGGRTYTVRRAGTAELAGEPLYEWAVLRELSGSADAEIVLLAEDGSVLAQAKGYESKILRSGCEIRSWGEGDPTEIGEGTAAYRITLYGVSAKPGVSLSSAGKFRLEIRGSTRKEIYSGCRVGEDAERGGVLLPPRRLLTVLAASRTEETA